jgi:threonine/homoserine/homoserine lactone efflux protein
LTIPHALFAFTLAAALMTMIPGLDTALILRTAAVEGPRRAVLTGLGIGCGCLTWGLAMSIGLGTLLAASQIAYGILRIMGACYLIVLGMKMLLLKRLLASAIDNAGSSPVSASRTVSASRWFARGLLTNLLNPKVGVFYVTFLPQFIPHGVSVTSFSMLLAAIHAIEGILWFCLLTFATRPLSRWLCRPYVAQALDRATGTLLVGFGVRLVLDNQN